MEDSQVDIRLQAPFTAMIVGPTGSGKTRMLMELIDASSEVSTHPPIEIHYCYGAWQEIFKEKENILFHDGLIDIDEVITNDGQHRWLIIDNLMQEVTMDKTKRLESMYTKHSHHRNISVFFVVQNMFSNNLRTISLNTCLLYTSPSPRDKRQSRMPSSA